MTITVDCRMLEASGVGVYLCGILPFFLQSEHDFLLLGNNDALKAYCNSSNARIIECRVRPFSITELFFFPKKILNEINKTQIYYSPFFNIPSGISINVFTTIHDIIFPDMPELTSRLGLIIRMYFYRRCFKISKKIFTVSEFSKSRINYYSKRTKPVIVTHSAIQPIFLKERSQHKKRETIVFIGNIKKHKGLDYLLEAYSLARNKGLSHKLLIIGDSKNFRTGNKKVLQKYSSLEPDAICFTGYITDAELIDHVASSSLLVQPSLYEGFCLPPLEALALGTPALISDIPVLNEIYDGFPVTFFKAGDTTDLKDKMLKILLERNPPLKLPSALLFKYTFEKTASRILGELIA